MAEPPKPMLQHAVVGLGTSPVAPLRLDNADGPSSSKMVSLADLHVNGSASDAAQHMMDTQGVDPLDPLLQLLVQDRLFVAAVQTSQLHAAAAAAVRLLRGHLSGAPGEFKRPADRRHHAGRVAAAMGYEAGGAAAGRSAASLHSLGAGMRSLKQDVLQLEDSIPWTAVRRNWRNRRTSWRRQVKQTELVADLAARLKELRVALLSDEATFIGCGQSWRSQLDACIDGRGSPTVLVGVWDEMRNTIRSWLGVGGGGADPASGAGGQVAGGAVRAVQALQSAARQGGADALLQTPLESIVGGDTASLHSVRQAVELERRILAARLAAVQDGSSQGGTPPGLSISSYFASIQAGWADSDFDSGADTDMNAGSDATDLDSDFDA